MIGLENGLVQEQPVLVQSFLGMNNLSLNLYLIQLFIWLTTLLLICYKVEFLMAHKLVHLELKLRIYMMLNGNIFSRREHILRDQKSQKNHSKLWEENLNIGTQWTWEHQEKILLETILPCHYTITPLFGKITIWCQEDSSVMDGSWLTERKCQSLKVISWPLDNALISMVLMQLELHLLILVIAWMMQTLTNLLLTLQFWDFTSLRDGLLKNLPKIFHLDLLILVNNHKTIFGIAFLRMKWLMLLKIQLRAIMNWNSSKPSSMVSSNYKLSKKII